MTTKEKIAHRRGDHLRATDAEAPPPVHWMLVKFCGCSLHTDFGLDPKMDVFAYFSESCLILRRLKGFSLPKLETTDEVLRIPLLEIEELEVETADRMTLGRIGAGCLLGGPFGAIIGGLWKKEDRFLRVDWGGEHSIVFGKAKVKVDALKKKITEAIRQVKEAGGIATIGSTASIAEPSNDGTDIAAAIQKLASLHKQGVLTDDEFATKKAELLSRM